MDLLDYQTKAHKTEQMPSAKGMDQIIPLLGLAGEVGELLNEFKKLLRDGSAHVRFRDRLAEELGDLLWYTAETATKFDLDLNEVAERNLAKTRARWNSRDSDGQMLLGLPSHAFDHGFPETERIPRYFVAEFREVKRKGARKIRVYINGQQLGQALTDNAHQPDGYRFHDVFHLACAAVLGWSPVTRRNLKLGERGTKRKNVKRKSKPQIDEVEDGGRAIVTEEGISALVFAYASDHAFFDGVGGIDYGLLKSIRMLTAKFEVSVCSTGEWEAAIRMGYRVWKEVEANQGGKVEVDLDHRSIRYLDKK